MVAMATVVHADAAAGSAFKLLHFCNFFQLYC